MAEPLIVVDRVSKHFGEGSMRVDAMRDIALSVQAGEVVGLRGPSGSGKTTLLNVIGCIVEPSTGRLVIDGRTVFEDRPLATDLRRLRLEHIGFIFQTHNLIPFLTVTENVSLVLTLSGKRADEARQRAMELLDDLQVAHRRDGYPAFLSGGEAQRVAIARALANNPRIILADEPTAALDSERAGIVMDLLRRLAREHEAAIVTVTHDEKIFSRFDRMISLRDGRLEHVDNVGSRPVS